MVIFYVQNILIQGRSFTLKSDKEICKPLNFVVAIQDKKISGVQQCRKVFELHEVLATKQCCMHVDKHELNNYLPNEDLFISALLE